MPKKKELNWPTDYIDEACVSLKRTTFEDAVRSHAAEARTALTLFQGDESRKLFDDLFQIACRFHRETNGIAAMKRARLRKKLADFVKTIQKPDRNLAEFQPQLQKWRNSTYVWERDYASSFLSKGNSSRKKFTEEWLHQHHFQLRLATQASLHALKQEFTVSTELLLRKRLANKIINGRRLGVKKQQTYRNILTKAVMLAANEGPTGSNKFCENARLRQQRSRSLIQRRCGPDDISPEEVIDYELVGQKYCREAKKKKQNSAFLALGKKKQPSKHNRIQKKKQRRR